MAHAQPLGNARVLGGCARGQVHRRRGQNGALPRLPPSFPGLAARSGGAWEPDAQASGKREAVSRSQPASEGERWWKQMACGCRRGGTVRGPGSGSGPRPLAQRTRKWGRDRPAQGTAGSRLGKALGPKVDAGRGRGQCNPNARGGREWGSGPPQQHQRARAQRGRHADRWQAGSTLRGTQTRQDQEDDSEPGACAGAQSNDLVSRAPLEGTWEQSHANLLGGKPWSGSWEECRGLGFGAGECSADGEPAGGGRGERGGAVQGRTSGRRGA